MNENSVSVIPAATGWEIGFSRGNYIEYFPVTAWGIDVQTSPTENPSFNSFPITPFSHEEGMYVLKTPDGLLFDCFGNSLMGGRDAINFLKKFYVSGE